MFFKNSGDLTRATQIVREAFEAEITGEALLERIRARLRDITAKIKTITVNEKDRNVRLSDGKGDSAIIQLAETFSNKETPLTTREMDEIIDKFVDSDQGIDTMMLRIEKAFGIHYAFRFCSWAMREGFKGGKLIDEFNFCHQKSLGIYTYLDFAAEKIGLPNKAR